MAVADLIKLIPEPSIRGQSHVVGLLSVLAISGSVALLTLSCKLKPSSTVDAIEEDEEDDQEHESDGWDGHIRRASRTGASSEASEMDGRDSDGKKKRVHFAEDVREPRGDGREYRRLRVCSERREDGSRKANQMPANRMALYRGLRQSRLQLAACFSSYS